MTNTATPAPIFSFTMPVRWRDLDAYNHVNNQAYLGFLEETRVQWLYGLQPDWDKVDNVPVLAASHLGYRRSIEWPATVLVELYVEKLGNSSMTLAHRIVDANDPETLYCDGNVVLVWIDRKTGKSAPLPDALRNSVGV